MHCILSLEEVANVALIWSEIWLLASLFLSRWLYGFKSKKVIAPVNSSENTHAQK